MNLKSIPKKIFYALPASAILMFHHVTDAPKIKCSGCVLKTERFFNQIERFSSFKSLIDIRDKFEAGKAVVTFDDGLEDLYSVAYPYLVQKGIPFTAFVVTDFIDKPGYITKAQLCEMAGNPLVTIGAHGITHAMLTTLSSQQKKNEIVNSKKILEDILGKEVRVFASSHGDFDEECVGYMKDYYCAVTTQNRPLNILTRRNALKYPRYNITDEKFASANSLMDGVLK